MLMFDSFSFPAVTVAAVPQSLDWTVPLFVNVGRGSTAIQPLVPAPTVGLIVHSFFHLRALISASMRLKDSSSSLVCQVVEVLSWRASWFLCSCCFLLFCAAVCAVEGVLLWGKTGLFSPDFQHSPNHKKINKIWTSHFYIKPICKK